jgi:predicted RNase H-like HicB family nuclease
MKFIVVLKAAEEGGYSVTVPSLDGCFTEGDTEADALKNAEEAIRCYLEGLAALGKDVAEYQSVVKELDVSL